MKYIKQILFSLLILAFSFFYTNKVFEFVKEKDPIMIKIKKEKKHYESEPINAIIKDNTIIPGKKGKIVNINKSYKKMKKLSSYSNSLYVYDIVNPSISINNQYDKLIIQGNPLNKNISILVKLKDSSFLENLKFFPNISIILDSSFFAYEKELSKINNNIVILEANKIPTFINYCYSTDSFKAFCINFEKYTIYPTFITYNIFYNTYQMLENGKIFAYQVLNEKDLKKVFLLVNRIQNLGYKIVSIDTLIQE